MKITLKGYITLLQKEKSYILYVVLYYCCIDTHVSFEVLTPLKKITFKKINLQHGFPENTSHSY